ncbi:unnamed protein product [Auanema sp. JU1783]|nr:unnamed protein product [Auanema sp. JU1783]
MHLWCFMFLSFFHFVNSQNAFLKNPDPVLLQQYLNAITAYGPGLGVFSPYSYVDISYDNIPFIGKVPIFGKEGTSSKLGISPFYPPEGNPSNPIPPLYRARPLPLHVPEPQDVVAVPLDEETLHGEPLFPPELVLPGERIKSEEDNLEKPIDPFSDADNIPEGFVDWKGKQTLTEGQEAFEDSQGETIIMDSVKEQNAKPEDVKKIKFGRDPEPKSPFRSKRTKRFNKDI